MSFSQKPTRRETEKGEEQRGETLVCVCCVVLCVAMYVEASLDYITHERHG